MSTIESVIAVLSMKVDPFSAIVVVALAAFVFAAFVLHSICIVLQSKNLIGKK